MDRDKALAVLKQAEALGLLPEGWWVDEVTPGGAVRLGWDESQDGWVTVAIWDYSVPWPDDEDWSDGREQTAGVLLALLDHLAGLGWTVKRTPLSPDIRPTRADWWVGRVDVDGWHWHASSEPGILGLLSAAVFAETWCRAREVTP